MNSSILKKYSVENHAQILIIFFCSLIIPCTFLLEIINTGTIDVEARSPGRMNMRVYTIYIVGIASFLALFYICLLSYIRYMLQGYIFCIIGNALILYNARINISDITSYNFRSHLNDLIIHTSDKSYRIHPAWNKNGISSIKEFLASREINRYSMSQNGII